MFIKRYRKLPKILDISKEKILSTTKNILKSQGYKALSVRRIAAENNMATGTFYLYFSSKEELVAQAMITDWNVVLQNMKTTSATCTDFLQGITVFYDAINSFMYDYRLVFSDYSEAEGSYRTLISRHIMLREQLSESIKQLAQTSCQQHLREHSDMIAECLLSVLNQSDMTKKNLCDFLSLTLK